MNQGKSEIILRHAEELGYEVVDLPLEGRMNDQHVVQRVQVGEICKKLEESGVLEAGRYDCALPQNWVDEVYKLGIDVRGSYVWNYSEDRIFGKPFNILEAYLTIS